MHFSPICGRPSLSEVSQRCLWNSTSVRLVSRKVIERYPFPRLSPPADRLCDDIVPAGSVSISSTVMVALPASPSARSFPVGPTCPGRYTHRSLRKLVSNIDTWQSGLPIPLFNLCSKFVKYKAEDVEVTIRINILFSSFLKMMPWFYISNSNQSFVSNETCPSSPVLHAPPFWYRAPTLRACIARRRKMKEVVGRCFRHRVPRVITDKGRILDWK